MTALRTRVNGLVVAAGLVLALPAVVIAERIRPGRGLWMAAIAVRTMARACGVTVEVRGVERLDPATAYVLVPNHSSILDTPAMVVARPGARFAAASELFAHPLLGPAMRALGTVPVDRRSPAVAARVLHDAAMVSAGRDLVVFPEGGLAPPGGRRRFKTGAFALAIAGGVPVVPVAIAGSDELLPPGGLLGVRPGRITVHVLEPVPTAGLDPRDRRRLRDGVEAAVLEALAGTG